MDPELTDEEERFMRWLEEDDVSGHYFADDSPDVPPHWHALRQEADSLGDLLRAAIPPSQEPPASGAFNDEVRRRLD
jgi:hypothetical protein